MCERVIPPLYQCGLMSCYPLVLMKKIQKNPNSFYKVWGNVLDFTKKKYRKRWEVVEGT